MGRAAAGRTSPSTGFGEAGLARAGAASRRGRPTRGPSRPPARACGRRGQRSRLWSPVRVLLDPRLTLHPAVVRLGDVEPVGVEDVEGERPSGSSRSRRRAEHGQPLVVVAQVEQRSERNHRGRKRPQLGERPHVGLVSSSDTPCTAAFSRASLSIPGEVSIPTTSSPASAGRDRHPPRPAADLQHRAPIPPAQAPRRTRCPRLPTGPLVVRRPKPVVGRGRGPSLH